MKTILIITLYLILNSQQAAIELKMIAGKDLGTVKKYLGKISKVETVNPSRTPCPCKKYYFKNGDVEIVFINNRADWITVYKPSMLNIKNAKFVDQTFASDYTYIKVSTK